MKKILLFLSIVFLLTGCGPSEEETAFTKLVHNNYKEKQIKSDTYVPFNILDMSIKDKHESGDTTYYNVEFIIQEHHPSRRYYYDGAGTLFKYQGKYGITDYNYHANTRLNH
mgnify:CR=1 FL=1